ncbi:hypothetical protein LEP1GSC188_4498 [Leptospira weilii serovar Topaz str. LT2116]|uniref:Uncharacterized protein n=1 Tax=Leptospira weilii serovar Topaz str. LT2116 TaxID=1088540 RepID=M3H3E3_9LEPT|nr:hypothetical protein LEP1GSC188_4498 [Leptospira weilii serovar Topaz str. LT2116]
MFAFYRMKTNCSSLQFSKSLDPIKPVIEDFEKGAQMFLKIFIE